MNKVENDEGKKIFWLTSGYYLNCLTGVAWLIIYCIAI